ncbi:TIR domain-containing protein [Streptomyces sp. AP-93]|uniref:TIR domain-containing protein n=1 Tax=Streptomyces sp. AP-93 TaxID=2929048 RepID=UPI001FAEA0DC|nr:TIR domain-containing protein [Streptomyces sp. AP-93]MCJ0872067.1 TIR domain-containing protein [Streptomyces sp. AP-93]
MRVVINHVGRDRSWAEWIAWELRRAGHRVVSDPWDWSTKLVTDRLDADAGSDTIVVQLVSPSYLDNAWTAEEWSAAVGDVDRLVPMLVEPVANHLLPPALAARPLLPLYAEGERAAVQSLLAAVDSAAHRLLPPDDAPAEGDPGPSGAPPRHPAAASPALSNLARAENADFGREALFRMLREKLLSRGGAPVDAATGADGIGAEEVAREYARRFGSQYDLVWRVPATDRASLQTAYAQLADFLGVPSGERGDRAADLLAHLVRRDRWLLVLAEAAAPAAFYRLLPPRSGHTLILSADAAWTEVYSRRRDQPLSIPEPPTPKRILAVATEWSSRRGGLSTFNRRLCRGLAAAGATVYCLVPRADDEEREDARRSHVTLLEAEHGRGPAWAGEWALFRKPCEQVLPLPPDVVIGHGRITGRAAQILADDHYPRAARVHILHMDPDDLEWLKDHRAGQAALIAAERNSMEVALGDSADHPFAVGRVLWNSYAADFSDRPLNELVPGFDGPESALSDLLTAPPEPRLPPQGSPRVLVLGRTEDVKVKGLDTASAALSLLVRRCERLADTRLIVRGVSADGDAVKRLKELLETENSLGRHLVIRPFSTDARERAKDLSGASLLVLPSRAEAFGLSAAEAIAAGTPTLVSSTSGVAALLTEVLGVRRAADFVVRTRDDGEDAARWSEAMEAVLSDRQEAFRRAADLRAILQEAYSWSGTAAKLLAALA